jgi:putative two-component system response regulator
MMDLTTGTKSKILVVDDEELNQRLISALLKPMGYDVQIAGSGVEALQKIQENPPDVILLDIMMPKMDGFEVALKLRENPETRAIPIVMVTALQDVEDRVRALEVGADDFLTKPVDRMELRARVRSLVKVKAYNDYMKNHQQALEAEVARRTEELSNAYKKIRSASLETIYRLSRAAEYKDEDTGAHILRMSNYSALLARRLGLADTTVERILYAAPMHDIGKIGIPDHVLLKPGKLSDGEWVVMRQHTTIGAAILEGANEGFIKLGEVIAATHHEKWDGNGYPRGLKGREIPLVGRIVAISDVFDALMSKRPYKEPFSLEKCLSIITAGRGSHFDPEVHDAFMDILDDVLKVREQYRDEEQSRLLQMFNLTTSQRH